LNWVKCRRRSRNIDFSAFGSRALIKTSLAVVVFLFTILRLYPYTKTMDQHGDERMYVWKAAYYFDRIVRLDFSTLEKDDYYDPGFSPTSFWAVEQPYGSHFLYALTMAISEKPAPAMPWGWAFASMQGPQTLIPAETLPFVRGTAIFTAALGLALITWRFGRAGALAAILLLMIPHVPQNLSLAWAEGPLLLGFGLCAISYRTRWFPVACGAAAAFKLTALGLWPLMFIRGANGKEFPWIRSLSIFTASLVWSILTPYSFSVGGPPFLVAQLYYRIGSFFGQSGAYTGSVNLFLPKRYLWPIELAGLLLVSIYLFHIIPLIVNKARATLIKAT
jgi:hypothetical protein